MASNGWIPGALAKAEDEAVAYEMRACNSKPQSDDKIVRAVPGLKVLSAIAICKDYKTKTMNKPHFNGDASNYLIEWARKCRGWHSADSTTKSGLKLCGHHLDPVQDCVRPEVCGWCDFKTWIKKQKMPAELKRYVLNVLNYLGKNSDEFRGRLWEDDEEWKEEQKFMDWLDKHMKHLHGQESSSSEDESDEEYLWSTDQGEVSSDTEEVEEDLHLRLEEEEEEGQNDEGDEEGDDSGHPCMTQ